MEEVIEKAVLRVPHLLVMVPDSIHGVRDPKELLQKPEGDVLIHRVVLSQNERDLYHALTVEGHPCRAVGLIQVAAGREWGTTVKHANIVETEKSTSEDIFPLWVLPV